MNDCHGAKFSRTSAMLLIGTAMLAAPGCALAATTAESDAQVQAAASPVSAPSPAPVASPPAGIGEIVVTASRRESSLLKTPAALTALSSNDLTQRQVRDVASLTTSVPGVLFGENNGQTSITIRGIGAISQSGGSEQSVGVYLDGVYQSTQSFAGLGYLDLARVEVLKGPQGALYGRNATGGVVNYISQAPTEGFGGYATVLGGTYGQFRGEGALSGPIADNLTGRVAGFYDRNDGYYKNTFTGERQNGHKDFGGRVSLHWTPSDTFTADVKGYYSKDRFDVFLLPGATSVGPVALGLNPSFGLAIVDTRPLKTSGDFYAHNGLNEAWGTSLSMKWKPTDDVTVTSLSSYSGGHTFNQSDCDGSSLPICVGTYDQKEHALQEDLYAQGKLFSGKLDWLVGASYYRERLNISQLVNFPPVALGVPLFVAPGQAFPPGTIINDGIKPQRTRSIAVYTDDKFSVTDHFRLNFGVRSTWDRKQADLTTQYVFPAPLPTLSVCDDLESKGKWSDVTFKGGAEYDVGKQLLYASVNQGFKAGGFNVSCNSPFNPEKITSYEAGLKGRIGSNIVYTLAGYYYDYSNLQVLQVSAINVIITNAAKAHGYGAEGYLKALLGGGLSTDVNLSAIKTAYNSFCAQDTVSPGIFLAPNCTQSTGAPGRSRKGVPLNKSPKFSGTLGLNYDKAIDNFGKVSLRGEVFHSSSYVLRPFPDDADSRQKAYTIGNVFITIEPYRLDKVSIAVFVKNVGNKHYLDNASELTPIDSVYVAWGAPRTIGVQASAHF